MIRPRPCTTNNMPCVYSIEAVLQASAKRTLRRIPSKRVAPCGYTRNPNWASHESHAQKYPNRKPSLRVWIHVEESRQAFCGAGTSGVGACRSFHPIHPVRPPAQFREEVHGPHALVV